MKYELPRDGEPTLEFDGELVARVDTQRQAQRRAAEGGDGRSAHSWTELVLYVTAGGTYVLQTVARTDRYGWTDWFSACAYATAELLVRGVRKTKPMMGLLDTAAGLRDDIAAALDSVEASTEHLA